MEKEIYISTISSYGTVSNPEKRYVSAIMFSDKEKFLSALIDFLRMQVLIGTMIPEYKEELGEVNIEAAFSQIQESLNEISNEFDGILPLNPELDNRLVIYLPEILTDFHLEFFHPTKEEFEWLVKRDKIGILALEGGDGCIPDGGEFYFVNSICDPLEKVNSEIEENPEYQGMTNIEKWNHLLGGAFSTKLIKV